MFAPQVSVALGNLVNSFLGGGTGVFLALWPMASSSCLAFLMSAWGLTGQGTNVP